MLRHYKGGRKSRSLALLGMTTSGDESTERRLRALSRLG
jgi:hypothetical protein